MYFHFIFLKAIVFYLGFLSIINIQLKSCWTVLQEKSLSNQWRKIFVALKSDTTFLLEIRTYAA